MAEYTAGPWKMDSGQVVRSSDGAVIANMDRSEEASKAGIYPAERDSNARLIAAAPDMLDALDRILALAGDELSDPILNGARAAVAKALGFRPTVERVRA